MTDLETKADEDEAWYRGISAAGLMLQVKMLVKLRQLGIFNCEDMREIVASAMADLQRPAMNLMAEDKIINQHACDQLEAVPLF
ncbi:hypothetical protein [Acidisphaera sp. L21]|uniref:hypothetical protein n=1 Tax=Acidisphaera sp. L21 TaxID=1641851 RepID=UPI00131C667A|nr:hypothetical protein [Acidisphaera sp. L21]